MDGRSAPAKRMKAARADLLAAMGRAPSVVEGLLLDRAAAHVVMLEAAEAKLLLGKGIDTSGYCKTSRTFLTLLGTLGIKADRAPAPSLSDYIREAGLDEEPAGLDDEGEADDATGPPQNPDGGAGVDVCHKKSRPKQKTAPRRRRTKPRVYADHE
ncbi:MAG: hypothetical protein HY521_15035 [Proteobacteria bacterium]|nr:hypothetical protein [Pseudomonadota bacterium]